MSHYPVSGLLLRSYKCKYAFVPIFHSGPVRIERSGNSTLDIVIENMDEKQQLNMLEWVKKCFNREIYPIPSPAFNDLLVFFFKPAVTNIRAILTKKKNSYFLALFLDKCAIP